MFLGALNPTAETERRLELWTRELWPDSHRLRVQGARGSRCEIFLSGEAGVLERRHFEDAEGALALDGWLWNEAREAEGELWGGLGPLAGELASAAGWPLSRGWDGSFACALFHRESGGLTLAVDPIGLHRLFYARSGDCVVFGSVQSAVAFSLGLLPDAPCLALWLATGYLAGRRTLFEGLREVMIGERLRLGPGGELVESRADVPWHGALEAESTDAAADRIAPLLQRNARRFADRLAPDRGGLALSGGMDSRLVLGALGEKARGLRSYTYGGAGDYECELARRCAEAAGTEHSLVDLTGRYFPPRQTLRRRALLGEAIAFPFWVYLDAAAQRDGVETLWVGDLINALNVYIKPLRGRGERLRRSWGRITGRLESFDENPMSSDEWLGGEIDRCTQAASRMLGHWRLDTRESAVRERAEEQYHELFEHLQAPGLSLFRLQERFFLAVERGASGGGQVLSLAGTREIIPIFSTRKIVSAGWNVPYSMRSHRGLIDAVARRVLSPALRRLPTATIPLASLDAPKWSQEALWLARFAADAALSSAARRW
ncbi:MAG: asparagine synthase-related protein, partial [Acidobacteriota bacterium]